jgi:hypothetical protein
MQHILQRWSPFPKVNSRYGAPMGRYGDAPKAWDGEGELVARHCGGDGYYDSGGAYWGHSKVYAVWVRGRGREFCAYVEAVSKLGAIALVIRESKE